MAGTESKLISRAEAIISSTDVIFPFGNSTYTSFNSQVNIIEIGEEVASLRSILAVEAHPNGVESIARAGQDLDYETRIIDLDRKKGGLL